MFDRYRRNSKELDSGLMFFRLAACYNGRMKVTPLRQSDEMIIRAWARDYLIGYLDDHASAYGLGLADEELSAHIDDHELESALWNDLVHADYGDTEFVGVMRESHNPCGLILAEERIERYLRVPIGVIRWIYVSPDYRRQGLSKALMAAAHRWMARRRIAAVETTLTAANEVARRLYEQQGFAALELRLAGVIEPTSD